MQNSIITKLQLGIIKAGSNKLYEHLEDKTVEFDEEDIEKINLISNTLCEVLGKYGIGLPVQINIY